MSEGRNLWIGLLLGMLLTGLLMFALHQQADLPQPVEEPTKTITHSQVFKPETPESKPKLPQSPAEDSRSTVVSKPPSQQQSQVKKTDVPATGQSKVAGQEPDAGIVLPEGLDLSEKELQELSAAELVEYKALISSYREVRGQVLQLQQEREQLSQRMDAMFQQNEVMESELDKMREAVRLQSEGK